MGRCINKMLCDILPKEAIVYPTSSLEHEPMLERSTLTFSTVLAYTGSTLG